MYKEYTDLLRELEAQLRLKDDTEAWLCQALARAEEKLEHSERETEYLRTQLDKLRRTMFGHRSEKITWKIAALETELEQLEREGDAYGVRVNDPAVRRPQWQTQRRKPFPESLTREVNRLFPVEKACPDCGGALSYPVEDAAEQPELMRRAFRVIRTVRGKHACQKCDRIVQALAPSRPTECAIAGASLLVRVLTSKYAEDTPLSRHLETVKAFSYALNQWGALAYYSDDGCAGPDNNIAENVLRMVSLGAKNWLFFGSDHGGERDVLM